MVLWIGAVCLVVLRLDHVVLQLLSSLSLVVVDPMRGHRGRLFRLRVIVLVELLNVQAAASLVHVHAGAANGTLDLNSLGSVSLLGVQIRSIPPTGCRFDRHNSFASMVVCSVVIRSSYNGSSSWVEAKVSLVHKLLIEGGIDCLSSIVVGGNCLLMTSAARHLCAILE